MSTPTTFPRPSSFRRRLLLLTAALPFVLALGILARFALPIPMLDDYHMVLRYLLDLHALPHTGQRLLLDFTFQHGEYRMMLLHLLIHAQYALLGHLELRSMIWLGNLVFVPLIWVLWLNFRPVVESFERRLLLFLPFVFLLVELVWCEQLDWIAGILYYAVPLAFLALHFLLRAVRSGQTTSVTWALLFLMLSCLLSAQGFLLVPLGAWILWTQTPRRVPWIAAWIGFPACALAMYVFHYQRADHGSIPFVTRAAFFLSMLGNPVENMHRRPVPYAAMVLGVGVLLVTAHAVYTRFDRREPFIAFCWVWCLLTDGLIAMVRAGLGTSQSLAVRYKLYGALLLVFCYR